MYIMKETDFYVLDWGNGMVGIFRGSTLGQANNGSKEHFFDDLKYVMRLYDAETANIHYLSSHEELNRMREERNLERKPTLDKYLADFMSEYETTHGFHAKYETHKNKSW